MQENEFEKQVREMMEKFRIAPSDSVWDKVEQRIPKEKRRRRWVVFFLLFAGLTVSGYVMYNNYYRAGVKENTVAGNQIKEVKNNSHRNEKDEESNAVTSPQNDNAQKITVEKNSKQKQIEENKTSPIAKREDRYETAIKNEVLTPVTTTKDDIEENKNLTNESAG